MPVMTTEDGLTWRYDIDGEGQDMVFLHGWGVDRRIWRQQVKYFSEHYRTISIDLPGHGESSWEKLPVRQMAAGIGMVLAELGSESAVMVSSSLGGLFALHLYQQAPDRISALIFVGSMPKFAKSADYPYGLDVEAIRKLDGQLNRSYPSAVNIFFRSLFTKQERESRRYKWMQKFHQTDAPPMKGALVEYLDVLEHEDLRDVLRGVTVPMQFINGRGDTICDEKTVRFLATLCPQARFDFFEECGHFPFLSKPHEFNTTVESFLDTCE